MSKPRSDMRYAALLMSTHSICFYRDIRNSIPELFIPNTPTQLPTGQMTFIQRCLHVLYPLGSLLKPLTEIRTIK